MKKILTILFTIISLSSLGQAITQRSGASFTVQDARLSAQYNLFIPRFADTTAANLQKGIDSCGAIIFTYDVSAIWFRNCNGYSSRVWIQLLPSGGGTGQAGWLLGGNLLLPRPDSAVLGSFDNEDFYLIANNLKFLKFNKGGIQPYTSDVLPLGINNVTGDFSFASTTGTIPTWQQTLDAGSVLNKANNITGAFSLTFTDQTSFNIVKSGVGRLAITNATTQIYAPGGSTGIILSTTAASMGATGNTNIDAPIINIANSTAGGSTINIGGGTTVSELVFLEGSAGGTNYVGFKSNATLAGNTVYTLPIAFPAGTYLLNSTSAGVMGFTDPSTFLTGLTVGTTTIASGTIGGVIFQGAGNAVQQDATNLFWDDINNRLGVGTNVPANTFDALSSGTAGRFKSSSYSSSTVIIEDPDGTTWITNGQFRVNTVPFVLNANASYLSLQTAGVERINVANAGDITLKGATIYAIPVTTGVDLSGGQYNAADAGLYHITVGDVSNAFNLPDAAAMTGKTVKIIMKVGDSSPITSSGGSVFDKLGSALSTITGGTYTFTSDGTDWWEF